jgi:hypothetical protein
MFVSSCLFPEAALSSIATAVVCEGNVPRINDEDAQLFFYLHISTQHVSIQRI